MWLPEEIFDDIRKENEENNVTSAEHDTFNK
jgi:hypothetical protein